MMLSTRNNVRMTSVLIMLALVIGFATVSPAVASPLPSVAVYSSSESNLVDEVITKLIATGSYSQVDNLSPVCCGLDPTPTLATLQQYAAVMVWSGYFFNDSTTLGNVLADYVDGGGHVVVSTFAFSDEPGIYIAGRFDTGGYQPLTHGRSDCCIEWLAFLVADIPSHPLLAGVSSFDGGSGSWHIRASLAPGGTQVAHWANGFPLVAFKGSVVALNFFPPSSDARADFWNSSTDGVRLITNALNFGINAAIEVGIDIIPGSHTNLINRNSSGTIPVAILSTADFDARSEIDRTSLTFGRTGDEHSLVSCNSKGKDVNGDGLLDLVCNFQAKLTGFQIGDSAGILRGQTVSGVPIEGQDTVKIVKK